MNNDLNKFKEFFNIKESAEDIPAKEINIIISKMYTGTVSFFIVDENSPLWYGGDYPFYKFPKNGTKDEQKWDLDLFMQAITFLYNQYKFNKIKFDLNYVLKRTGKILIKEEYFMNNNLNKFKEFFNIKESAEDIPAKEMNIIISKISTNSLSFFITEKNPPFGCVGHYSFYEFPENGRKDEQKWDLDLFMQAVIFLIEECGFNEIKFDLSYAARVLGFKY